MAAKKELLQEIYDLQKSVKTSNICLCCKALEQSGPKVRDALAVALADPQLNASTIGKWLRSKDVQCSDFSIRRHRRGECKR